LELLERGVKFTKMGVHSLDGGKKVHRMGEEVERAENQGHQGRRDLSAVCAHSYGRGGERDIVETEQGSRSGGRVRMNKMQEANSRQELTRGT